MAAPDLLNDNRIYRHCTTGFLNLKAGECKDVVAEGLSSNTILIRVVRLITKKDLGKTKLIFWYGRNIREDEAFTFYLEGGIDVKERHYVFQDLKRYYEDCDSSYSIYLSIVPERSGKGKISIEYTPWFGPKLQALLRQEEI